MKIAILYDGLSAVSADQLIVTTVDAVERELVAEGNTIQRVAVGPNAQWIDRLRRARVDLVFNLCESIDGVAALEPPVISVLELLDLPYSGSSSWTASLCLRKHVVNAALERAGLPVPKFAVVRRGGSIPSVGFPAICKPAAEDASIGVEQRSVVRTTRQLTERVGAMLERWDEVLVQRYIEGREVNVGILGDATLPIAEIDFGQMPKGMWRIVTYRSKWETGSDEDLGSAPQCPARLPASVATGLRKVAMAAWRMVGGAGYGRVDFRIDERGRPWILEVNANPDIAPDAGLARMAGVAGIEYGALVRQICELGLRRARGGSDTADQWALAQRLSGVTATDGTPDLFTSGEA
ncbi:MAG: D-alanine--D-alanine ligase [Gemmatimonadetes bacterium]|jgi:D-alanine-D-alanine ligase|nr:D-alanine--D-alanine ligase [Gemmatimonadota bacterium]